MGWPQHPTPTQIDNTIAVGVVTNNVMHKQTKSMGMQLWCLRCRTNQKQFRPCWASGKVNCADYTSKHHSGQHHIGQRLLRLGLRSIFDSNQAHCERLC